ncbi:MAG: STAS domain-containing protein [Gammaproteobacteria bacterium]|jgi:anti-sigma B factor antagonist
MKIVTLSENGHTIKLSLAGRLDMVGNQIFEMELPTLLSPENQSVILDISELEFIASIGLRSLVSKAKELAKNDRELILCNPKDLVKDILTTSGLNHIIKILDTCEI